MPLSRRLLQITLALYWVLIFTLTHVPGYALPNFNIWDKLEHTLAYAFLATLLFLMLRALRPQLRRVGWIVIVACFAYGAIDEWLQIPVGRDCSIFDWFADGVGTLIAVSVLSFVFTRKHRKVSL
jgi:VanZ family protein